MMKPKRMLTVQAGKVRAIATTGAKRSPVAPQVPTLDESGVRGYVVTGFHLLLAPGATPADIVAKLNAETVKALESPAIREKLASFGLEPASSSPAECAKFVPAQIALWTPVMKAGGIRAD